MIRLMQVNVLPYFCIGNGLKDQATGFLNSFIHPPTPHFISTICRVQVADCPGWLCAQLSSWILFQETEDSEGDSHHVNPKRKTSPTVLPNHSPSYHPTQQTQRFLCFLIKLALNGKITTRSVLCFPRGPGSHRGPLIPPPIQSGAPGAVT